jgi:hypothetical protein
LIFLTQGSQGVFSDIVQIFFEMLFLNICILSLFGSKKSKEVHQCSSDFLWSDIQEEAIPDYWSIKVSN